MKKLTAEKCREQFEEWLKSTGQNPPYATKRGYYEIWKASREALEISLPILEQQERGCQKCGGTGMADSGGTQPWGEQILIECDCKSEQHERGEGEWIEWGGNRAPFNAGEIVQIRLKDGDVDKGPWSHFHWGRNCMNPIIAYRMIENDGREG